MSILINIEMPHGCFACPMVSGYMLFQEGKREPRVQAGLCRLNRKIEVQIERRPQDCPLTEQKTSKWIDKWYCSNMSGYEYAMKCSECGKPTYRISLAEPMPNYCPNCGARMVEE